ncbi:GTPase Era [Buchnera aphidicola (Pemphigus obesinymphae)]|uniref:GTPase Era n=1 Tax=Buchnera aphidicola TaxID=9 RepID=UPI0022373C19|nr:GTPase Era [Buchnera aphidicola]MCW5196493.1 GTPase Era [Buchnera aphidicola (Pemphigus obesinymphae)]
MKNNQYYSGLITIIGKSNTGKSTILNKIMGKKISITSHTLHTTQRNIFGIQTQENYQSIYIDTPGIQKTKKKYITNIIDKKIDGIIFNSNIIIFVVEHIKWNINDEIILNKIRKNSIPTILVINKIDLIKDKKLFLPHVNFLQKKIYFKEIIFVSAKHGENIKKLSDKIKDYLPLASHCFPKEQKTNYSKKFIFSEIIREKIIRNLNKELPYIIKVKIKNLIHQQEKKIIHALIFVKNINQKKILIGKNGRIVKKFSVLARKEIEKQFNIKVSLYLWIKIGFNK